MAGIATSLPASFGPAMTVGGTVLSAGANIGSGIAARRAGDFQGDQADQAAGQAQAASQRTAMDLDRRSRLVQSKALANAAASGGGASDPTVIDAISRIAGEGAYRSQLALYEGNDAARTLRMKGDAARYQGQLSERAGYIGAFGSLLKGGATLFEKYGGGGRGIKATDLGGVEPYFDPSTWGMS